VLVRLLRGEDTLADRGGLALVRDHHVVAGGFLSIRDLLSPSLLGATKLEVARPGVLDALPHRGQTPMPMFLTVDQKGSAATDVSWRLRVPKASFEDAFAGVAAATTDGS
jgi:hypothetical protein